MSISDDLARLNQARFQAFDPEATDTGVQAAFAFAGDVYEGLKARDLDDDGLAWAQDHLRILSGLYGLLRPLDRIQPYRLEMGTRLKTRRGSSLYDFWGDRISKQLNADAEGQADPTLVQPGQPGVFRRRRRPGAEAAAWSPPLPRGRGRREPDHLLLRQEGARHHGPLRHRRTDRSGPRT